jgi:predicted glycoside hydrolase/deacetylase ChbG (UPF0249 family)
MTTATGSTDCSPGAVACEALVCVDDLGLHEGVGEACVDLARRARISIVSAMAGAPAWRSSAGIVAELRACEVGIGLHLDLTAHPVDPALRHGLGHWLARGHLWSGDARRLAREVHAQLDAFEAVTGARPSHVDGHQHVHQLPAVRAALLPALSARYGADLPWLRGTRTAARGGHAFKARVIEGLGARGLEREARLLGFEVSKRLLGIHDFRVDVPTYRALLDGWLATARADDVLMCHPATRADDAIAAARRVEYEALMDWPGVAPRGLRSAPRAGS